MKAGDTRRALAKLLEDGVTGSYQVLAAAAGVPESRAQATLKEMSRCGEAAAVDYCPHPGRRGRAPARYAAPVLPLDPLAFVRQAWR